MGFHAKQALIEKLQSDGHSVEDMGTFSIERVDYPDYAAAVARAVASGDADRGVLVCGTGVGVSIAANKIPGIRAALCQDEYTARMCREHNDANVIAFGSKIAAVEALFRMMDLFLGTPYTPGRHDVRIKKIRDLETK